MVAAPLKLAAAEPDDLHVLSTLLQDAVIPVREMIYIPDEHRFVLVANRFRWEEAGEERIPGRIYHRVRCGLTFDRVLTVRHRGFSQHRRGNLLVLLAIKGSETEVDLVFAAGAAVRLGVESILCHAEDFDEPWPTMWRPDHSETGDTDGDQPTSR